MRVKATQTGFHGFSRRREGDVFDITDDKEFSSKWMEKLDGGPVKAQPEKATEAKASKTAVAREVI